jgi:hypothetical protein
MGKDGSNFSKQLKKRHLGADLITQIGKVSNVNFFEIIGKMKNMVNFNHTRCYDLCLPLSRNFYAPKKVKLSALARGKITKNNFFNV